MNSYPECTALVRECAAEFVGSDRSKLLQKTMGAEDFSYFLQARPGAFFFIGCALPGETRPHHKSVFDFDEVSYEYEHNYSCIVCCALCIRLLFCDYEHNMLYYVIAFIVGGTFCVHQFNQEEALQGLIELDKNYTIIKGYASDTIKS